MVARNSLRVSVVVSEAMAATIMSLGSVLYLGAGGVAVLIAVIGWNSGLLAHPGLLVIVGGATVVVGAGLLIAARLVPARVHRWFTVNLYGQMLLSPIVISAALVAMGPRFGVAAAVYLEVPIYAVYLLRPGPAWASVVLATANFAFVVYTQPGWSRPALQVLLLAVVLASSSYVFGEYLKRGSREAEQLAGFRRFLPESVADAILAGGDTSLFDPHRRAITVFFCDLRGFTHFAATATPEDVQDVLDAYFRLVGSLVHALGATVGALTGDGIMAYFGDPIPHPDSADRALQLACRLRGPMNDLVMDWTSHGFDLSYGIGIAHGHATLGLVGFEGRHDYTALGPVVNLAARLSDAAGPGETLVDQRTIAESAEPPRTTTRSLEIKGYDHPVTVHVLERRARLAPRPSPGPMRPVNT